MASQGPASSTQSPPLPSSPFSSISPTSLTNHGRQRGSSGASGRLRSASLKFMESSPPLGMWAATGEAAAKAPSLTEIRRGDFGSDGWNEEGQRRNSIISERSGKSGGRLSRTNSAQSPTVTSQTSKSPVGSPALPNTGDNIERHHTIEEEDDGFPDIILGRGEMTDQSYVKGSSKTKTRVPTLTPYNDSDLDSLTPHQPKRTSKNMKAMFGESPNPSPRPSTSTTPRPNEKPVPNAEGVYPNGYSFPPKHTWGEATLIGLKALGKFFITPLGFLIVLYGLNVVAWGGMLFLLLCNASSPMCYNPGIYPGKDCNNIDSPRRVWVEIDSQILNSLFCVTGFGLIPWRFRDLYYLIKFRIMKQEDALRRLGGIHKSWFRLPGSENLPIKPASIAPEYSPEEESNPALPIPLSKTPPVPLTGVRAPATALWKLDYVILLFVLNTFLQAVLSGFMWGYNRYARPSWSTGLFVALACIVAAIAGIMQFTEGKKVKKVEGVPPEVVKVVRDAEAGVGEKRKKENGGEATV
ncbi:hypothetical protein MMC13_003582 [Lambiella insularis]|nr:hypothetical protein [Lambiella insularis]